MLEGDDPPDPTQEIDVIPSLGRRRADPTPAGTLEVDADAASRRRCPADCPTPTTAATPADGKRKRSAAAVRFLVGFGIAALLVVGVRRVRGVGPRGYYVDFDDGDEAIIYRGRTGGVLWFEPTTETRAARPRPALRPRRSTRSRPTRVRLPRRRRALHQRPRAGTDATGATGDDATTGDDPGRADHRTMTGVDLLAASTNPDAGRLAARAQPAQHRALARRDGRADHRLGVHDRRARHERRDPARHRRVRRLPARAAAVRPPRRALRRPRRRRHPAAARRAAPRHRLRDDHAARRRLAGLQATWSLLGIAVFVATLLFVQRADRPRPLPVAAVLRRRRAPPAADAARARAQHQRRPHLGQPRPDQLPARRVRQDRARHLLRRVPRRAPRADRRVDVEGRPAPPPRAALHRADPRRLGVRRRRDGRRTRPRLVAAVLHAVRRDDVGRHRAGRLPAARARAVRRRRLLLVDPVQPRPDPRRHLDRPVVAARSTAATRSSSRSTASPTAA